MIDNTFIIIKNNVSGQNDNSNLLYWSQKNADEKFSAVEELRKDFRGEDYAAEQRFPGFYKIIKHA